MQILGNSFFTKELNFDSERVFLNNGEIDTTVEKKETAGHRFYRFLTFSKDQRLIDVNQKLSSVINDAAFIESIAKSILSSEKSAKGNFFYNIVKLNEKFRKGNEMNFFSKLILKVVHFVAGLFGIDTFKGYNILDIENLKSLIDEKLIETDPSLPDSLPLVLSQASLPIPLSLVALFSGDQALAPYKGIQDVATINQLWGKLSTDQQRIVDRLFHNNELEFDQHFFNMVLPEGHTFQMGIKSQGNVAIKLADSDMAFLQKLLTGSDHWEGRLFTCLLLVGLGEKALPLLDEVKKNPALTVEGVAHLLLTWSKLDEPNSDAPQKGESSGVKAKPEKTPTLLDRITDMKNPPVLLIEEKEFTVVFNTVKNEFVINNLSDAVFDVVCKGAIIRGDFWEARTPTVYHLGNRNIQSKEKRVVEISIPSNTIYELSYGKSAFTISYESLSTKE